MTWDEFMEQREGQDLNGRYRQRVRAVLTAKEAANILLLPDINTIADRLSTAEGIKAHTARHVVYAARVGIGDSIRRSATEIQKPSSSNIQAQICDLMAHVDRWPDLKACLIDAAIKAAKEVACAE